MTDQHRSRAAVLDTTRTTTTSVTTEIYEAAFSTTGEHPQCGIAIARTLHEARQRLADMLILCDPRSTVIADPPKVTQRVDCATNVPPQAGQPGWTHSQG